MQILGSRAHGGTKAELPVSPARKDSTRRMSKTFRLTICARGYGARYDGCARDDDDRRRPPPARARLRGYRCMRTCGGPVAAARRIGRTVRRGAVGCTWRRELGTTKRAGTSYRGIRMEIWRCARGAGNFTHSACDGTTANNNAVDNSVAALVASGAPCGGVPWAVWNDREQ